MSRMLQELYEEGRQEGLQEGDHARAVLVAEKLFRKGLSISEVMDITDLSEKELEEIRQRMQ
ncbi:transposase [Alicyclobacillus sp.]|uniref:transposase n=1 Tax=Alicyclobacillus sp. TaxID=61169 RepID=UPI0025C2AC6F|nr:transposase [Alicyclobacillus sp.]MCL6516134.1 transposase [Alicyclobacillus sp.]